MAGTSVAHPIALGVDSFGEMTVGDGNLREDPLASNARMLFGYQDWEGETTRPEPILIDRRDQSG